MLTRYAPLYLEIKTKAVEARTWYSQEGEVTMILPEINIHQKLEWEEQKTKVSTDMDLCGLFKNRKR